MSTTDIGMVALGYGKYVRARDIIALIPIEDGERGDRRRTYVHVAGIAGPVVASRSERAILADMERTTAAGAALPVAPDDDHASATAGARPSGGPRRWRRPLSRPGLGAPRRAR